MNINKNRAFLAISLSIIGTASIASSVDIPNTFTSGTPALASEVNENFSALQTGLNENDARVVQLEAQLAALQAPGGVAYEVGDTGPAGGIVFAITDRYGKHGFEAAPVDQSVGAAWGCSGVFPLVPGATGEAFDDGVLNTKAILIDCNEAGIAAELASNYVLGAYSDWFLPSKDELNEMYVQLHQNGLGGFGDEVYWSSSVVDTAAWSHYFNSGDQVELLPHLPLRVRAIRAF